MDIVFGDKSHLHEITKIFNHYIETSNARFEEVPMSYENRLRWFEQFSPESKYQIYVALENNSVLGFACSQRYRPDLAFLDTVEVTIYLHEQLTGRGIGSALYGRLLPALPIQGVHGALTGIALPNEASVNLHKRFGFREIGVFNEYAKKHGNYISSIWLEKLFD